MTTTEEKRATAAVHDGCNTLLEGVQAAKRADLGSEAQLSCNSRCIDVVEARAGRDPSSNGELNGDRRLSPSGYAFGVTEARASDFAFEAMKSIADVFAAIAEVTRLSTLQRWWQMSARIDDLELKHAAVGEQLVQELRSTADADDVVVGGADEASRRQLLEVADRLHELSKLARSVADTNPGFFWFSVQEKPSSKRRREVWLEAVELLRAAEATLRRWESDPLVRSMGDAEEDDEPLSDAEIASVEEAHEQMKRGATITTSELRRRLGLGS